MNMKRMIFAGMILSFTLSLSLGDVMDLRESDVHEIVSDALRHVEEYEKENVSPSFSLQKRMFMQEFERSLPRLEARLTSEHKEVLLSRVHDYVRETFILPRLTSGTVTVGDSFPKVRAQGLIRGIELALKRETIIPVGKEREEIVSQAMHLIESGREMLISMIPDADEEIVEEVIDRVLMRNVRRVDDPLDTRSKRLLSNEELGQLLIEWNDTFTSSPMLHPSLPNVTPDMRRMHNMAHVGEMASRMQRLWSNYYREEE